MLCGTHREDQPCGFVPLDLTPTAPVRHINIATTIMNPETASTSWPRSANGVFDGVIF